MTKEHKKGYNILGQRIPSGCYIGYDGSSLIGCGIVDTEDIRYINNELDVVEVFGNIWTDNIEDIALKSAQWLVDRGGISPDKLEETRMEHLKEIQDYIKQQTFTK